MSNQPENKMGTMSIGKLLFSMAAPMMLSMLIQACYNIVDSIYVSQVSENALTAVSLSFPVQNLMIGFSTGIAVGMNSLLSKCLGSKEQQRANRSAGNGMFLAALCSLLFFLGGIFFTGPYFRMQSDVPEIVEGGTQYLTICSCLSFGLFGCILFERLLQSTGRAVYSMITQATGAIINILLDPLFIFGGLGIPAMGVAGAAVATVIGQIIAMLIGAFFHFSKNKDVQLCPKDLLPNWNVLKPILAVGIPSIIMMAIGSVMTFSMNWILKGFSTTAVAVFGAYFKLQSFIFMPIFGLNNALVSIVAYNYGAKKPDRIKKTIAQSCAVAFCFAFLGFCSFMFFPQMLLSMFNPTEHFLAIGCTALRTIAWHYLLAGFGLVLSAVFQALGNGIYSTITSLARQLVVLVPVAYLLSLSGNVDLVWWSFPIAEVVSLAATIAFFIRIYRKKILPIVPRQEA